MKQELVKTSPPEGEDIIEINEYVTFFLDKELFALNMAPVQEIVRVPELVRVPKSHPALLGLGNLRGSVLPVIDLRKVLGLSEIETNDSNRVIVVSADLNLGLLVDRVASVITADPSQIEEASDIQSIVKSEFLGGVIRDQTKFILLLNVETLLKREFYERIEGSDDKTFGSVGGKIVTRDTKRENEGEKERQLISFMLENEEYGIDIDKVQEIVQMPSTLVRVPGTEEAVCGVINLRDRVLPLISLRALFQLKDKSLDETDRIIVVNLEGFSIGLVVDSVREVLRVPYSLIEPAPELLFRDSQKKEITEICKLDSGKRLVSIISVSNLLNVKTVKEALSAMKEEIIKEERLELEEFEEDEEQVVVFKLSKEEYAVPIEAVQEIVRIPEELTHVPKTTNFVEGIMNLRGNVLPVIDLKKRFELEAGERNEQQRIIVFVIDGVSIGFIVDSVSEVLKIPKELIFETPSLSSEQKRLFPKVANIEKQKRIIQFINPRELLKKDELEEIVKIGEDGEEL